MAFKIIRSLMLICLVMAGDMQVSASTSVKTDKIFIRVAILNDINELTITIHDKYQIVKPESNSILKTRKTFSKIRISSSKDGIFFDDELYPLKNIRLIPQKEVAFYLTSSSKNEKVQRYRGAINIILKPNRKFLVVNVIELEQYIKGVLYHEVSHRWPMEATRAQAVAARTYALYQINRNKDADYDVTGDIYSQVYGGRDAERFRTNIAVNRTQGQILIYEKKILPAYFHSSCGGHTENARNIWGNDLVPLYGSECSFCKFEPNYNWKKNFRLKDVQDKLNSHKFKIGVIQEIRVLTRNKSGRIKMLLITDRNGKSIQISGIKFREIIGPNIIRSNKYEIVMKGYYFDLIGNGWGHGVGLCQWGAHTMAQKRYKYDEILRFYYPGTEIIDYRVQPPEDLS